MALPDDGAVLARASLMDRVRAAFTPRVEAVERPGGRDARLDMFRGLALVMIFINHVPGNFYENLTSRNFGFSDAAEAFVFMSGLAAGLAYSGRFATGPLWPAIARVWARARHLYFVHLTITMLALAIFAAAAAWFGLYQVLESNNIAPLFQQPLRGDDRAAADDASARLSQHPAALHHAAAGDAGHHHAGPALAGADADRLDRGVAAWPDSSA